MVLGEPDGGREYTKGPVRLPLTIGSVIVIAVPGEKTFTSKR